MKTDWYKTSFIYQIYPFSFKDSNNDGVGDIEGIISKLDYIKDLGIDAIWFSPLYDSPNHDYGYDIRDYKKISPLFGTMDDFKRLIEECHNRNIKVIMDMVINHTSSEHKWFKEAIKNPKSKYRDYYIFRKGIRTRSGKLKPPTNYQSSFTGSAWENVEGTDDFYLHIFNKYQPDLNFENEELRNEITDIFNYYFELGVDGFRLDVFNLYSKLYPFKNDNRIIAFPRGGKFFIDGPRIHEFLKEFNSKSFSKYDSFIVGESYTPNEDDLLKYIDKRENELDAIFDFSINKSDSLLGLKYLPKRFNLKQFKKGLFKGQTRDTNYYWNTLVLENHDLPRSISSFGLDQNVSRYIRSTFLSTIVFLGLGTVFIYQGEEIGMTNMDKTPLNEFKDPTTHMVYNLMRKLHFSNKKALKLINIGARDHARTPMSFNDKANAGFNESHITWMKVCDNYKEVNVEKDLSSNKSIYRFYQYLINLKKNSQTLTFGLTKEYSHSNNKVIAYTRSKDNETYLIIGNFSNKRIKYHIPKKLRDINFELVFDNYDKINKSDNYLILDKYEALVLMDKKDIKKEYSYGALLYKVDNGKILYLIEHMTLGHTSIPKGHIEENETILECVKREIKEELNLDIEVDMTRSHKITYSPSDGIIKDVVFYTAKPTSDNIITQKEEVLDYEWVELDECLKKITHDSDKEVIMDLSKYIMEKENIV